MSDAPPPTTLVFGSLPAADVANALLDLGFEIGLAARGVCTVLDSFDGRLFAAGITLCHLASVEHPHDATLVLSAPDSIPASMPARRVPRFVDALPAGPLRQRLSEPLEMRAMSPVLTFDDTTIDAVLRDGRGRFLASATVHSPSESDVSTLVEIIAAPGHDTSAHAVIGALTDLGGTRSEHGLIDLVARSRGIDRRGFDSSPNVDLDQEIAAIDGFRLVLTNLATTIAANLQGTIDDIDTEFLHEFRVAIRRTRSVLGLAKFVLTDTARASSRTEFAWLAGVTGPLRDLDVYILEWDHAVGHLASDRIVALQPVLLHLQQHRKKALRNLITDLRSERTSSLLAEWTAGLGDLEPGPDAEQPLREIVAKRIAKAYETVLANGRKIDEDSAALALHDLRKDAKKLRYAVECFGGLLPSGQRKAFVRQLKGLQDNLGRHQDAEVHSEELQLVANELSAEQATPSTLLALGQLIEHLELEQMTARAEFANRYATFDSTSTHRIVDDLLHSLTELDH